MSTLQRMNNKIHLPSDKKLFQLLRPEVFRRELPEGDGRVLVASSLLGEYLKFVVWIRLPQLIHN